MATNKSWVLGSDYFKDLIEQQLNRQTKQKDKGGDRKSKKYREQINRV
jgi:putative transposase